MLATALACTGEDGAPIDDDGTAADSEDAADAPDDTPIDPGPFSLVGVEQWAFDGASPEPFTDPPPDPIVCEVGWGLEDGVFEIDSGLCNWGVFTQPSQVDVLAGDLVEVILLHDTLYSEDPEARAHLGAALAGTLVWETELMIPAATGFLRPTWTADGDYPAGTPVRLHVHNHGYNNYRIVDITVTRQ